MESNFRMTPVALKWFTVVRTRRLMRWYSVHEPEKLAVAWAGAHLKAAR